MNDKSCKAFVCFCVDGPSDKDTLNYFFQELFDDVGGEDINVEFRFASFQNKNHGDITSLKGVNEDNVEKKIYKYYFKEQDTHSSLGWNDLTCIIHIIDTDGAYISEDKVVQFTEQERQIADDMKTNGIPKDVLYFDDHVGVREDVQGIISRNKRKRQIIEHLLSIEEITVGKKTVKYYIFFFSSNLEHFLYGEANNSGATKARKASSFAQEINTIEDYVNLFVENEFCGSDNYYLSWKEIKKRNNSLQRGSNINVLINLIKESTIDDWL